MKRTIALILAALLACMTTAFAFDFAEESLGLRIHDESLPEFEYSTQYMTAASYDGSVFFYFDGMPVAELDVVQDEYYAQIPGAVPYIEDPEGIHHNGYTYVLFEAEPSTDEEVKRIPQYAAMLNEALKAAEFFPPVPDTPDGRLSFATVNLDGEVVTDAVLSEKQVTMVNVWATYCNPCLNEMPELAKLEGEFADDAQILYLCSDLFSTDDAARMKIAEAVAQKAGVDRSHILLTTSGQFDELLGLVSAVPTTFFVDRDGMILEEMIVGADVQGYRTALQKLTGK